MYEESSFTSECRDIILFEIYKRFENLKFFPNKNFLSGPEELRRITHEVCSEANFNKSVEEHFYKEINDLYDDIANHKKNLDAISFSKKYKEYICKQLKKVNHIHDDIIGYIGIA